MNVQLTSSPRELVTVTVTSYSPVATPVTRIGICRLASSALSRVKTSPSAGTRVAIVPSMPDRATVYCVSTLSSAVFVTNSGTVIFLSAVVPMPTSTSSALTCGSFTKPADTLVTPLVFSSPRTSLLVSRSKSLSTALWIGALADFFVSLAVQVSPSGAAGVSMTMIWPASAL